MTGKFGKMLGMALAVCMIVSCLTGFGKEEVKADQTPVKYLDYNESSKSFEEKSCNAYSVVGTTTTSMTGQDSWYVVNGDVTVSGRISVTGTVNLILMNGCKLTASKGIEVNEGNTLIIYRQARNEGTTTTPGELVATGIDGSAGIGGGRSGGGGTITINGGTITATGGYSGAGIGGGEGRAGGNITINGGTVTAASTSGSGAGIGGGVSGAGIGGGGNGAGGSIEINGGTVTAVVIYGGGAGIGGGGSGVGGSIEINGGTVTAEIYGGGAGIGGGFSGTGGHIEINGGTITAFSDQGSGIGKGMIGRGTGTYSLGTGMKGFSSASEDSGYSSLSGSFGDTDKYVIIYKNESGFLTASGNVITAKYVNESDSIQSAGLGITAPAVEEIIFGDTEKNRAKLDRCDVFNTALGRTELNRVSESQIKYYNSDGHELKSAPTAKGSYTAKINVDGVTAAVDYTIIKDDPQITHPTAGNLMYRNSLQELVSGGSVTGGTLLYSFSETGDYTTETPKGRDIGSYTVYYKVVGNEGYKDSITYQLSVSIQKANASGQNPDPGSGSNPTPAPQPGYIPAEPVREETKAEAENSANLVANPDGTISEISVTTLKDGSIITSETVRDKDGKFVEYKYEYTRTAKNGTTCVKSFNKKADGSQNETFVTTTKSGTVSTVVKEVTADGTVISKEGKSYADGRTSIKEAITGSDGVTKVVTEKTDAAGNGVWAEYTSITDDARISLTTAEVTGTTLKLPGEIWVNEQHFVVTEIAKNLLKNNKTVSKLTIGENITKIGASAFRNMTGLKKITINAANLEEIGKNAFKGVGDKKTVTIIIKGVTEAEFEKICEMIRAAGIGKKVKFVMG